MSASERADGSGQRSYVSSRTGISLNVIISVVATICLMLTSMFGCTWALSGQIADMKGQITGMSNMMVVLKASRDEEIRAIKDQIQRLEERLRQLEQRRP